MTELDVFRIPGSRPIPKSRGDHAARENQWDERFFLGRIPDYNAMNDKHCLNFLTTKKRKATPGRVRRMKTPAMKNSASRTTSTKTFLVAGLRAGAAGPALREQREHLLELWRRDDVPEDLWVPWLEAVDNCSLQDRSALYAREIDETNRKTSAIQTLMKAIQARELALEQLSALVRDYAASAPGSQLVADAKTALGTMREVTLEVVETAAAYKEKLSRLTNMEKSAGRVVVAFHGQNYLLKLKNDLNFLSESPLAAKFSFSEKSDPFLIVPAQPRKTSHEEVLMTAAQVQRIRIAEKVILDEILYNRGQSRERSSRDRSTSASRSVKKPRMQVSSGRDDQRGFNQTREISHLDRSASPTQSKIAERRAESPISNQPSARLSKPPSGIKSGEMPSSPLAPEDFLRSGWKIGSHRRNLSSTSERPNVPIRPPPESYSRLPVEAVRPYPPAEPKPVADANPRLRQASEVAARSRPPSAKRETEPRKVPIPEPKRDPTLKQKRDPTPEPKRDPTLESRGDRTPEPKRDPTPEPKRDPTPEPKRDPALESRRELSPEPIAEPTEVVSEVRKSPTPEPLPELKTETALEPPTDLGVQDSQDESRKPLLLQGFDTGAEQLEQELEDFLQLVPVSIRESFWDKLAFSMIMKQSYPAFLQVSRGKKRIGTVAFSVDTLTTTSRRVYLHHISAFSVADFALVLDLSLQHIWDTLPCDEIRISLNYRDIDGKLQADPDVKTILSERSFRWKNLTNTADGRRILIMGLKRSEEAGYGESDAERFFAETFMCKYAVGVQVGSEASPSEGSSPASYIGLVASVKELGTVAEDSTEPQRQLKALLDRLAMAFTFPSFRRVKDRHLYGALETILRQRLTLDGLREDLVTSTACLSVGLRWSTFDTSELLVDGETYSYLRVTDTIVNRTMFGDQEVFLVPSDDPQFNLLFVTSESGLSDSLDPWTCACETLGRLTNSEKAFTETVSEIWLPGFVVEKPETPLGQFLGTEILGQGVVETCAETFSLVLEAPIHKLGNVALKPSAGAVVLRRDFIVAVLNRTLDDLAPLPYIAVRVRSENFAKPTSHAALI